jgi:hypothetical protein
MTKPLRDGTHVTVLSHDGFVHARAQLTFDYRQGGGYAWAAYDERGAFVRYLVLALEGSTWARGRRRDTMAAILLARSAC